MQEILQKYFKVRDQKKIHSNPEHNFDLINIIPEEGNFQLLISDGLRNRKQAVNEKNNGLEHIEIYFCLPEYWNLETKDWPIHWLNRIAQVPSKNDTWFGLGDTMPAGNPPGPISDELSAEYFILNHPNFLSVQFQKDWAEDFQLLAVIPIFKTEFDYKTRNSHTILFRKFDKKAITEMIDNYRESACRKRVLGMF